MAEGIRISPIHPWPDSAMVVVTDHARPFTPVDGRHLTDTQPVCSVCGTQHFAKTHHIQLQAGSAIVSAGVWDDLCRLPDNPFLALNPVAEPPTTLIFPGQERAPQIVQKYAQPIRSMN